jgi:HYDIN/CFA65/VesB family protein
LLRLSLIALLLLVACSGEERTIVKVSPRIAVCSSADLRATDCEGPFDLGDRPVGVATKASLYVQDRGDGSLDVLDVKASDPAIALRESVFTVAPSASHRLELSVTAAALALGSAHLVLKSDDKTRPSLDVELRWNGIPKPVPKIQLCVDRDIGCGNELSVDFATVRRTEEDSRTVFVANVGTASLAIARVEIAGTSTGTEFHIETSTKSGELEPGASAPLVIVYRPADGGADRADILIESDDPASPEVRVHCRGASEDNLPPIARAIEARTGSTSAVVDVGDRVVIDGSSSSDPEGDPLVYGWMLTPAIQSTSTLADARSARVSFIPDTAGSYRVDLVVSDSLGLRSAPATVEITARPHHVLKVLLDWQVGGDLDLHLVKSPSDLFSSDDCDFMNPRPSTFDAVLASDSTVAPGREEIEMVTPVDGTYRVYVHDFDEGPAGGATPVVRIVFDDASTPAFESSGSLPATCALWYVGDVILPQKVFAPANTYPPPICR